MGRGKAGVPNARGGRPEQIGEENSKESGGRRLVPGARSADRGDETAWPPADRVIRRMRAERDAALAEAVGLGEKE